MNHLWVYIDRVQGADMITDRYHVISETSEDRFGETLILEDAIRIARTVALDGHAGEPVSIEFRGKVIRQIHRTPDGRLTEDLIG